MKFNPGPNNLTHQEFISLKQEIIKEAIEANCQLITSFILHDVASNPNTARFNEINRITYNFNCLLTRAHDTGIVLLDRFTDKEIDGHLREKFNVGITNLPYSSTYRLDRILGIHFSAIGQSNFTSLIDVIIGSVRFAINEHTKNPENPKESSLEILRLMAPLYPRNQRDKVRESNLFFSPKVILVRKYREKYEALKNFFVSAGIFPEQEISDHRTY